MDLVWILIGVAFLYVGGEALVGGAKKLAVRFGVQPMVIGLTVVAFGTSMPEFAATLTATLQGVPEVAFGNVVGSNIANLGLVLGLGAVVYPLHVKKRFLFLEVPFMVAVSGLMMFFAYDGKIGKPNGLVLLALLVAFLVVQVRREQEKAEPGDTLRSVEEKVSAGRSVVLILAGTVLLSVGAKALILGAIGIARWAGLEERVIGLTVVAFGTSLPELAGTLVAAARREGDIILGNLIGSNIFNILFILGASVLVEPIRVTPATAEIDLAVMLAFSVLVWPLMVTKRRLGPLEGSILALLYATYIAWLFIAT